MEINMKESGSFGVGKMLKTALPEYKLGELVEGAKVTFLETKATEETDETFDNEASKMNLEDDKMIDEKELIRRALLGSREAQQACTDKGIVLPCPCCKGESYTETFFERKGWRTVVGCSECPVSLSTITYDTEEIAQKKALKDWNTRQAPPVGRCEECALWKEEKECPGSFCCTITGMERESNDFCSEFEPREE